MDDNLPEDPGARRPPEEAEALKQYLQDLLDAIRREKEKLRKPPGGNGSNGGTPS